MTSTSTAISYPPEEFVVSNRRLFIDTNVFMDTDPAREGALKRLFERCGKAILSQGHPIVVPSKVVDELRTNSKAHFARPSQSRPSPSAKAANALVFLGDAEKLGLIRTDLGDISNPYADDLFVDVFKAYAPKYEMCLITNDITLRLRIRLLAAEIDRRLVTGTVTKDGLIEVDSDQALYERGVRKLKRKVRQIDEGSADNKDHWEVDSLTPLLDAFRETYGVERVREPPAARTAAPGPRRPARPVDQATVEAFSSKPSFKGPDAVLPRIAPTVEGDEVRAISATNDTRPLILGALLGEGGEGRVYNVVGDDRTVVKVFDPEHRSEHRKEKVRLLLSRKLERHGIGFPISMVTNLDGEFVGYEMPRASGKELQATVMRPARFKRTYPNWSKADLVDVCISFLEKVAYLHSLNILLGDINPKNVMLDADKNVWIIDADSWQLEGYPCPVGTPMFTASNVKGDYADALRTEQDELFAVATMLFMILITGQFPYARSGVDGGDFAELIRSGKFAFQFKGASDRDQPEGNWKFMWSHLPFPVKRMFWNTFHRDGTQYDNRPSAVEWLRVFSNYRRFFGSSDDFDPMSHDVYPTRFRKMEAATPEYPCGECGTSLIGRWQDERKTYWTPELCDACRRNVPKCSDCSKPRNPAALRDGRCWECNHKRNYGTCVSCAKEIRRVHLADGRCINCQLVPCKDCRTPTMKPELKFGRCTSCAVKAGQLNPNRLCADCRQPFITPDHEQWFISRGLSVPKTHQAVKQPCPLTPTHRTATYTRKGPSTVHAATPARKSLWRRFSDWMNS